MHQDAYDFNQLLVWVESFWDTGATKKHQWQPETLQVVSEASGELASSFYIIAKKHIDYWHIGPSATATDRDSYDKFVYRRSKIRGMRVGKIRKAQDTPVRVPLYERTMIGLVPGDAEFVLWTRAKVAIVETVRAAVAQLEGDTGKTLLAGWDSMIPKSYA